jgi:hypothetical protein
MERRSSTQSSQAASTAEGSAENDEEMQPPEEENEPSEFALEGLSFELAILNEEDWWSFRKKVATKAKQEVANFLQKVKALETERIQAQLVASNETCVQQRRQDHAALMVVTD